MPRLMTMTPPSPFNHAWCLDADDRVVDPTWRTPGLAYFGLVFDLGRVAGAWSAENQSVLDDWPNKWPALREPYAQHRKL